jgi:hypothetical protein
LGDNGLGRFRATPGHRVLGLLRLLRDQKVVGLFHQRLGFWALREPITRLIDGTAVFGLERQPEVRDFFVFHGLARAEGVALRALQAGLVRLLADSPIGQLIGRADLQSRLARFR